MAAGDDEILEEARRKNWPVYRCDVCNCALRPGKIWGLIDRRMKEMWLCPSCWEVECEVENG